MAEELIETFKKLKKFNNKKLNLNVFFVLIKKNKFYWLVRFVVIVRLGHFVI
jgi:hypothetical protein